jgi:hypothetical protein
MHDLLRDRAAVELALPAATREVKVAGSRGFLFPVTSEAGDAYQLFLWFDGSGYQVKVVSPEVEGCDPHVCHLFPGARLCLGSGAGGGQPTLEGAYAKAVLWANGFSVWRRTGTFPF